MNCVSGVKDAAPLSRAKRQSSWCRHTSYVVLRYTELAKKLNKICKVII